MWEGAIDLYSLLILPSLLLGLAFSVKDVAFNDSPILGPWSPEALPALSPQLISYSSAKVELIDGRKLLLSTEACSGGECQAEPTTSLSQVFLIGKKLVAELESNVEFSLESVRDGDSILIVQQPKKRISLDGIKSYFREFRKRDVDWQLLATLSTDLRAETWAVRITMKDLKFGEPMTSGSTQRDIIIGEKSPECVYVHFLQNIFANILISGRAVSAYTQQDYKMLIVTPRSSPRGTVFVETPAIEVNNTNELVTIQTAMVKEGDLVLVYYPTSHGELPRKWLSNMPRSLPLHLAYVILPIIDPDTVQTAATRVKHGLSDRDGLWPLRDDMTAAFGSPTNRYASNQGPAYNPYRSHWEVPPTSQVFGENCYTKNEEAVSSDDESMSFSPRQRYQRLHEGYEGARFFPNPCDLLHPNLAQRNQERMSGSERKGWEHSIDAFERRPQRQPHHFPSVTVDELRAMRSNRVRWGELIESQFDRGSSYYPRPQLSLRFLGQSPLMMELSGFISPELIISGNRVVARQDVDLQARLTVVRPVPEMIVPEMDALSAIVKANDYVFVHANEGDSASILVYFTGSPEIFTPENDQIIEGLLQEMEAAVAVYRVEAQAAL